MTTFTRMSLDADNLFIVWQSCACGHPNGCSDCCGTREIPEVADLTTLLRNLAVAGALCEARLPCWSAWYPGCGKPWSRAP